MSPACRSSSIFLPLLKSRPNAVMKSIFEHGFGASEISRWNNGSDSTALFAARLSGLADDGPRAVETFGMSAIPLRPGPLTEDWHSRETWPNSEKTMLNVTEYVNPGVCDGL